MKNNKQTAIYCRVAGEATGDGFEIFNQEKSLLAYAEKQGYINLVSYLDHACSGLTLDRPEFSKLTENIKAGKVAIVIVRDLSRIGRDHLSVYKWLEWVKTQGVSIITPDDYPVDLSLFADLQKAFVDYVRSQNRTKALKRKGLAASTASTVSK